MNREDASDLANPDTAGEEATNEEDIKH